MNSNPAIDTSHCGVSFDGVHFIYTHSNWIYIISLTLGCEWGLKGPACFITEYESIVCSRCICGESFIRVWCEQNQSLLISFTLISLHRHLKKSQGAQAN